MHHAIRVTPSLSSTMQWSATGHEGVPPGDDVRAGLATRGQVLSANQCPPTTYGSMLSLRQYTRGLGANSAIAAVCHPICPGLTGGSVIRQMIPKIPAVPVP